MVTRTVPVKPLTPLGGADRAGRKIYFGVYTTTAVNAHDYIQISPNLDVSFIDVSEATNLHNIPLATSGNTASTGIFLNGATTATTGVAVFVVGKTSAQ